MAQPGRTQKQIAERYKGNLGYYRRLHPWRRARLIVSLAALLGGLVVIWMFHKHAAEEFFNPGELSVHHATLPNKCDECHDKSLITDGVSWGEFKKVVGESFQHGAVAERVAAVDLRCEKCHLARDNRTHTFHEANVSDFRNCSSCHQEHSGGGPMKPVSSRSCATCHNDPAVMQTWAQKPVPPNWTPLHRHPQPAQKVIFSSARPANGYTQTFSSFWEGHPEFQINLAKTANPPARDPNVLRFNHSRHFAADIPPLDRTGRKLDCNYCHQVETEGRFMKRVTFAANCQACHSLQFDARNPDLHIPHGDATHVLGFLRSLPTQFEDLARRRGMSEPGRIRSFIEEQRRQLRSQFNSDGDLIRSVFFAADPYKPQSQSPAHARANFAGCNYCHEVKASAVGAPVITPPVMVDRWMLLSDFNHSKHTAVKCETCHAAALGSSRTSDILLPAKASCVTCHSPQGRVSGECITCHQYHAPAGVSSSVAEAHRPSTGPLSVKQMLLGRR